jgi:hypothetical protein
MANKASADKVQADMQPPNFRAAVQRIRTIQAKKDKIGSVNGEIADIYAKIEGHKVNRQAARIFYALDRMEADDRADVMRSLNGLCDASGWDSTEEDLVDQAEGTVVELRFGGTRSPAVDDSDLDVDEALADEASDEGDDLSEVLAGDDFQEATAEELAAQAGRSPDKAKSRAREKLDAAPFTGDNADLADLQPQGAA